MRSIIVFLLWVLLLPLTLFAQEYSNSSVVSVESIYFIEGLNQPWMNASFSQTFSQEVFRPSQVVFEWANRFSINNFSAQTTIPIWKQDFQIDTTLGAGISNTTLFLPQYLAQLRISKSMKPFDLWSTVQTRAYSSGTITGVTSGIDWYHSDALLTMFQLGVTDTASLRTNLNYLGRARWTASPHLTLDAGIGAYSEQDLSQIYDVNVLFITMFMPFKWGTPKVSWSQETRKGLSDRVMLSLSIRYWL